MKNFLKRKSIYERIFYIIGMNYIVMSIPLFISLLVVKFINPTSTIGEHFIYQFLNKWHFTIVAVWVLYSFITFFLANLAFMKTMKIMLAYREKAQEDMLKILEVINQKDSENE